MPYNERKMNNLDYVVDRKNNAYIVAKVYADDTNEKVDEDGNPNYAIEILKVAPGAKEVERFPVNLADKFVQTVWIYESPKGQLVCAGFYNKGKKADNADGIITFRLSDDGKVLDVSSYEIPLEILNQYASARTQRKNEKKDEKENAEFKNLKLKEIHFAKDGGMLLISEQYYYNEYNLQSQHGIMTRVSYSYDDILVAKLSTNGKLDWMKKIPKRQVGGAGQGGMSYKYARSGNDHYFLFLDNERNRDLALDEVPATHHDGQGGYLIAYKLDDKTGDGKKVSLLNTRNVNGTEVFYYMPSRTVRTGPGEFVFEVYKKKKEDILIWVKI